MKNGRGKRSAAVMAAMIGGLLTVTTCGCDDAEEFRAVAGGSVEQGVNLIVDGIIDGLFAVFEPDDTSYQ